MRVPCGSSIIWDKRKIDELYRFPTGTSPVRIIVFGDSTAENEMLTEKYGIIQFGYGGGLISSYYFLEKFIKDNGKPELCIFLFNNMQWAMEDPAPNSFYRPFFSWKVISNFVFEDKMLDKAYLMFYEGFLPSRRYRMFVLEFLKKHSIFDLNTAKYQVTKEMVNSTTQFDWRKHYIDNDTRMRKGYLLKVPYMQEHYFNKICDLMKKNNIKFVIWESPIPETINSVDIYFNDYMKDVNSLLAKRKDAVTEYKTRSLVFSDDLFIGDGSHIKRESHEVVADAIYGRIVSRFLNQPGEIASLADKKKK
jgi:hypothetical protein